MKSRHASGKGSRSAPEGKTGPQKVTTPNTARGKRAIGRAKGMGAATRGGNFSA